MSTDAEKPQRSDPPTGKAPVPPEKLGKLWGVGTPKQVMDQLDQNLKDNNFAKGLTGRPDTRTESQKNAAKFKATAAKADIKIDGLNTGSVGRKEPVGPIARSPLTHQQKMRLWRAIEPHIKRPDNHFFNFKKRFGFTRSEIVAAFKTVRAQDARQRAQDEKTPHADIDHQVRAEVRLKSVWDIITRAREGGILSSAVAGRQLRTVKDEKDLPKVGAKVDNMGNATAPLAGIRGRSTVAKSGPANERQLRRSDPQVQLPRRDQAREGKGRTAPSKRNVEPSSQKVSAKETPKPTEPKPQGRSDGKSERRWNDMAKPATKRSRGSKSGRGDRQLTAGGRRRRTPEQLAKDFVRRSNGKLVDRDGALANIFRRTRDEGNPAKRKGPHQLHDKRTAYSRELADIHQLIRNPEVARVELVPSKKGGRTNDFYVYRKDGSRFRWETTTATSAPGRRMSLRRDAGKVNPLVAARSERIPTTSTQRQAELKSAIDRKLKTSSDRPKQLKARHRNKFPQGGTLSIHAPFARVTRSDCDEAIAAMTPKLTHYEREVVIWRMARDSPKQALQNLGERYVRQEPGGSYKHVGTLRQTVKEPARRVDGGVKGEKGSTARDTSNRTSEARKGKKAAKEGQAKEGQAKKGQANSRIDSALKDGKRQKASEATKRAAEAAKRSTRRRH